MCTQRYDFILGKAGQSKLAGRICQRSKSKFVGIKNISIISSEIIHALKKSSLFKAVGAMLFSFMSKNAQPTLIINYFDSSIFPGLDY